MTLKNILWLVPFICFLLGYSMIARIMSVKSLVTPPLIGQRIQDAITLLSTQQLNARILAEKEDSDYQAGTILSQSPQAGQKIKPHQSVFLVVAKKMAYPQAPHVVGLTIKEAQALADKNNIRLKVFFLESNYAQGQCIAQIPVSTHQLPDKTMIAYISAGAPSQRLFPDLKDMPLADIKKFLGDYGIKICAEQELTSNFLNLIQEQKPLAGSLINISKPLLVQLRC